MKLTAFAATAVATVALAGSAVGAVPASMQGTFSHTFGTTDFPSSQEPFGTYSMKITPTLLVWTSKGLGQATEQIKVRGATLRLRDKPGSLGRLCATDGWGTYRVKAAGKSLTFTKVKDPCGDRALILAKTWKK